MKGKGADIKALSIRRIIVMGLLFFVTSAGAQWTKLSQPLGRKIISFTANDSAIFAGAVSDKGNGVFVSSNNGASWNSIDYGLPTDAIKPLLVADSIILVTTRYGLHRSSDDGVSWTQLNSIPICNVEMTAISGENFLVKTRSGGIVRLYHSGDYGAHWDSLNSHSFKVNVFWALTLSGSRALVATQENSKCRGLYLSKSSCKEWTQVTRADGMCTIRAIALVDSTIFVADSNHVFISNDNGKSWAAPPFESSVDSLATGTNTLFAKTMSGQIFRTIDKGASWMPIFSDSTIKKWNVNGRAIAIMTANKIILSTDNGDNWNLVYSDSSVLEMELCDGKIALRAADRIVLSTDNGKRWSSVYSDSSLLSFAMGGKTIIVQTRGGILLSNDNGASWSILNCLFPTIPVKSLVMDNGKLYALTDIPEFGGNIFTFTHNGKVCNSENTVGWLSMGRLVDNGAPGIDEIKMCNNLFFIHTFGSCRSCITTFLSADNGVTWTSWRCDYNSNCNKVVNCLTQSRSYAFQGTDYEGILRSADHGVSWVKASCGLPYFNAPESWGGDTSVRYYTPINSLAALGDTVIAATDSGICRSIDNGTNWVKSDSGLPGKIVITSLAIRGSAVFAGTQSHGVYFSANNGVSWFMVNSGLADTCIGGLYVSGSTLFAQGNSVWLRSLSEIINCSVGRLKPEATRQSHFDIHVASRAHGTVTITFSLQRSERTCVTIYDLAGRRIAALVNGMLAPGAYQFQWDARNTLVGNYPIWIQTGNTVYGRIIPIVR